MCLTFFGRHLLLIGYIAAFHFSKWCDPIKQLIKTKRRETLQEQDHNARVNNHYGSIKKPSKTHSTESHVISNSASYTGQFTTITSSINNTGSAPEVGGGEETP